LAVRALAGHAGGEPAPGQRLPLPAPVRAAAADVRAGDAAAPGGGHAAAALGHRRGGGPCLAACRRTAGAAGGDPGQFRRAARRGPRPRAGTAGPVRPRHAAEGVRARPRRPAAGGAGARPALRRPGAADAAARGDLPARAGAGDRRSARGGLNGSSHARPGGARTASFPPNRRPVSSGARPRRRGRFTSIRVTIPAQHPSCTPGITPDNRRKRMGLISLIWGIVALAWMILALLPIVGITNWLLIPFAAVGAILAAIGILFTRSGRRGRAKAGLVLNALVIIVAIW